jgi:hypothetical protein
MPMPCRAECVGHGHGCAGPAEWVKDDSRRGRRSGLRAGAGALSGDAVGQPCSRPGTCHSPAGQHLEAGRKSALEGRRCSARKLRTGASGCRRVSQIRVTERAAWRAVDHSWPTVGAAVECHRRVLGRSARTLNGLAERPRRAALVLVAAGRGTPVERAASSAAGNVGLTTAMCSRDRPPLGAPDGRDNGPADRGCSGRR